MTGKMSRIAKSILVLIVSISVCYSQSRQTSRRPAPGRSRAAFLQHATSYKETQSVARVVFRNGLTVLVNENRSEPVVSMQAYVRSGYFNEPPEYPGITALLAAMVYRGAVSQSSGTFRQRAQTLGGFFRRSVEFECTMFEITAAASQWKRALNLQAAALLNPSFDKDVLKIEANHVMNEARAALADPFQSAREKLLILAFNQPRMARFGTLTDNALTYITPENLQDFYGTRYVPAEITLVVSGDIRSNEILNEIDRIYDKFSGIAGIKPTITAESVQKEFRYSAMRGNVSFPRVILGFHTGPENAQDSMAVEVLSAILGLGEGSIISHRLRDRKKLIFHQKTELLKFPKFGYLMIQMIVESENLDKSEIAALTEIELLKRNGPDEFEMARAVAQLEHSYWKGLETVSARAQTLSRSELSGNEKGTDRYITELKQVKASDVKQVANRYLRLSNCSLLEYLPNSDTQRNLSTESIANTLAGLMKPSADEEAAERAKEAVNIAELPESDYSFKFSEIRHPFQLASILRGPEMFVREDHTSPMIDLGIFFPGGKLFETEENSGITELMANLMLGGGSDQAPSQFHRQMETLGGRVKSKVTDDYFGFHYSIPSVNFSAGFDLLREAIKNPDFNEEWIDRQKQIQSALAQEDRNGASFASQQIHRALFADFAYSLDRRGTEKSLSNITLDAVQGWYNDYVKNRKPVVVAVGDTKGTSLALYFVQHFSGSRMESTEILDEYVRPLAKAEFLEKSWENSHSLVFIGFQAPPEDDEDGYASTVLEAYVGELGRLAQALRDRAGTAFDISAVYDPRLRGGSFIILAAANPGNEEEVIKSLKREIQSIIADPIPGLEFRSALNAASSAYSIRSQIRSRQIEDIVKFILAGRGIDGYKYYAAGLKDVKENEFKGVTQRILDLDRAVILRLNGKSGQ